MNRITAENAGLVQLGLPLEVPEEDRDYHPFEPWSYSGDMNTPLGCKRCLKVLWHPIHGLAL